jgi:hypothetical protein
MPEIPQQKSQSSEPQPEKRLPEMGLADFRKLAKSYFSINCEETDEPYKFRFIGPPYVETEANCRSVLVSAHNRGKALPLTLSPLVIAAVLRKFDIPEERFHEAYDLSMNRVQPIRPTAPTQTSTPNTSPDKPEKKEVS